MTSVEKLTQIKNGKKERVHLVLFPHYEVQGEVGDESIQVWLTDKQLQLLLNQLEKSMRI
mgnify:CR=1 FL=1|tara:strand:- start:529 stop:708 length:180 start_codon:yes stop_codon:yes gene_type:complete